MPGFIEHDFFVGSEYPIRTDIAFSVQTAHFKMFFVERD
jgi:hypothetical protein